MSHAKHGADISDVRRYWNENPLLSLEVDSPGSPAFFAELDRAKCEDSELFALQYWAFDKYADKRVLDIGCGPGWVSVQYAQNGANVISMDLTTTATKLCRLHLANKNAHAEICEANGEALPFANDTFDLVVASGVLHHTPDTFRAFKEAFRVTRPGGESKITLYRKGLLHSRLLFGITMAVMRLIGMRHPGANLGSGSHDVDDFIRRYDGDGNPVGIGKTNAQWERDLVSAGWQVVGREVHFFPKRFIPAADSIPRFLHYLCDRLLGTMIYFRLFKPAAPRES